MSDVRVRSWLWALIVIGTTQGASWGCADEKAADAPAPKLAEPELQDPRTCATCHVDHFREWSGSMHAYAGVDPIFLALNRRGQRETNGALGTFCVNCHAPLAVRAGLTKDGLNLAELDPKVLGVNCFFCHASEFAGGGFSNNPLVLQHDGLMRGGIADPVPNTAHEAQYSTSHDHQDDRAGAFCGSCHDIITPPGAHIERTFVEWRKSHFALAERQTCGACHMPERTGLAAQAPGVLVRKVHDHSMPAVDVALTAFPEMAAQRAGVQQILDTALSAKLCVTSDGASGVRVEATLLNEKVGHFFPSGSAQDRRAWVEIEGIRGGMSVFGSGHIGAVRAVATDADPQIFLLRDYNFDAQDKPTHLFWKTARVQSMHDIFVPRARGSRPILCGLP